jgi:SAM-dependent methyltransferase
MKASGRDQFLGLLSEAVNGGSLVKLTLGKPAGTDPTLENLFVRPVALKAGPRFAFVWHHATRDITKNHDAPETLGLLERMIGSDFMDAHLFTTTQGAQLETGSGEPKLRIKALAKIPPPKGGNDRQKQRAIPRDAPWLHALGVTELGGRPAAAMADKFRQIEKFAELLGHLIAEAPLPADRRLRIFDMGCGKGYLTFAASEVLGDRAEVIGVEARADLVDFCSRQAEQMGFGQRLSFRQGSIADTDVGSADVMIALHACDTATDDALAKGIVSGAALLVVAPCCQKELRPRLVVPPVLSGALKHGIFEERQAEFVTDALRAQLLEWAGYRTRVIEFVSTEHTAKNIMISAVRGRPRGEEAAAARIRAFAAFYGIKRQALAAHLGFALS